MKKLLWQQIPSTIVSELLSNTNFDGIVLDTEHSSFNNETLYSCIQVIKLSNKKCFIRFSDLNKSIVKMCLDAGCDGVIFSTVETYEQSKEIIDYCRYPKYGGIRGQGLVRENNWGKKSLGNKKTILIAQIETKKGVDNIEKIIKNNFDYYLIGPYDLSASLNCVGDFKNNSYINYIEKIKLNIPLDKLGIHIPKDIKNQYEKYKDFGLVALGMDTLMISQFSDDMFKEIF